MSTREHPFRSAESPGAGLVQPTAESLLDRLADGRERAVVTFAGQGPDALAELHALLVERVEVEDLLDVAAAVLREVAASPRAVASGRYRHGLDVAAWADDPEQAPDAAYLRSSAVSYPLVLTTQLLTWHVLLHDGLGAGLDGGLAAITGHSSGLLAALAVAEDPSTPFDEDRLARAVRRAASFGLSLSAGARGAAAAGAEAATPMAAVRTVRTEAVRAAVDAVNLTLTESDRVAIALHNAPGQLVLAGSPEGLSQVRQHLAATSARERAERDAHRRGGTPLVVAWEHLGVDVPYHTPGLSTALHAHLDLPDDDPLDPSRLVVPVLSPVDGGDLREVRDLGAAVARSQFTEPIDWPTTLDAGLCAGATWFLDVGPGTELSRRTAACLRGTGARVIALASPEGRRVLATPGAAPAGPDLRYDDLAPRRRGDGTLGVENRFTRTTGRPPVVLAGMTPTTSDAGIVAAAANAGYLAELAGGGQVTPDVFAHRVTELERLLEPGREVAFNALLLDPYLWDLHLGSGALVTDARAAMAPLCGVTVSGGVPDVDEGTALLARLRRAGLHHNTFKPGTVEQVGRTLAIADAAPDHPLFVHLEGGHAGGHHSWEDLEELLLETYHDLRLRPHVVLCVGGGIGTPERAAELLSGTWAHRHGRRAMPVDAVLIGTAAMACKEATTSPAVKQLLVDTPGTAGWVGTGQAAGGVTSGRSHLGADIHWIDNDAAATARLLDEVAGDVDAIEARRDEIVAALARTAKPYFGDLADMTYAEVLARLTELCATGRDQPLDDGRWGDPTWRSRALELYRRFAARLDEASEGEVTPPVAVAADLDDPLAALERFIATYPQATTTLLVPSDVDAVVATADSVGKPVPFVVAIDRDVRRRYSTDALWQAHDDRFPASAVLVIPGPIAVSGITRADEPIADLLDRFHQAMHDAALPPADPDGAAPDDVAFAPAALTGALRGPAGPVSRWCATPSIGVGGLDGEPTRSTPNPLWGLVRATDQVEVARDPDGRVTQVTVTPTTLDEHGSRPVADERAIVGLHGDDVVLDVVAAALDGTPCTRRRTFRPYGERFVEVDAVAAAAEATRTALGTARAAIGPRVVSGNGNGSRAASAGAGLLLEVDGAWALPDGLAGSYAAATGARHGHPPLDLAFTLAWPGLSRLLSSDDRLAAAFGGLLHRRHEVTPGPAWPPRPGEHGALRAELVEHAPRRGGDDVRAVAVLSGDRGRLATVTMDVVLTGGHRPTEPAHRRRPVRALLDVSRPARAELLLAQPWLTTADEAGVAHLTTATTVELAATVESRATGPTWSHHADGTVVVDGSPFATIALEARSDSPVNPVQAVVDLLAEPGPERHPAADRLLAHVHDRAPHHMRAFATIGGDANPLHRDVLAARQRGLDAPLVHGLWIAARAEAVVVDEVAGGDATRLRRWAIDFVAPLAVGAEIEIEVRRTGTQDGAVIAAVTVSGPDGIVATGEATIAPPRTGLVLPGQGVQRKGMGLDGLDRSAAARAVWERADAVCRDRLGFSLLQVVRDNPTVLEVHGAVLHHPGGVLQLTQITQVALGALAAAQVAELREAGALPGPPTPPGTPSEAVSLAELEVVCGHSVGEVNALVALGVVPFEDALELLYRRGLAMQAEVPRDADGRSPYGLGVADPRRAGIDVAEFEAIVVEVARETGELLEVVNRNAEGRQYGVAGTTGALAELDRRLAEAGGRRALVMVEGIDVPFHSSALAPAVARFREDLDRLLPPSVDPGVLDGRYVPNLLARPFRADRSMVDALVAAVGPEADELRAALLDGDPDAATLARRLLVELLARQIAAPVRWIETQELLLGPTAAGGLGLDRVLEVGPGHAPVLTNLARTTLEGALRPAPPALVHSELDRHQLLALDADPAPAADEDDGEQPPASVGAEQERAAGHDAPPLAVAASSAGQPTDRVDAVPDVGFAAVVLLALQARVRVQQLRTSETLDALFEGVSSRRNQVLVDLGREFGVGAIDGAQDLSLAQLEQEVQARAPRYRFPGPYLRDALTAAHTKAFGRSGLSRAAAATAVQERWAVGPGLAERAVTLAALGLRDGPSVRGGGLGDLGEPPGDRTAALDVLDRAVTAAAEAAGVRAARIQSGAGGGTVDAAQVAALRDQVAEAVLEAGRAVAATLGHRDGPEVATTPEVEELERLTARLTVLDDAVGAARGDELAPHFSTDAIVSFTETWATARWDLLTLFHDALDGRRSEDELRRGAGRLARHRGDPTVSATTAWLVERAADLGRDDVVDLLGATTVAPSAPTPSPAPRPVLDEWGHPGVVLEPDPGRAEELRHQLLADGLDDVVVALDQLRGGDARLADTVALVTGAGPGSIAEAVLEVLLAAGARVVATSSSLDPARRRRYRDLYGRAAAPGAELHLVPANLAAFGDIDDLVDWLADPATAERSARRRPLLPDLVVPFAAVPTVAGAADAGPGAETALRVQLLGVARLVGRLGEQVARQGRARPATVVLPLSPNEGDLGGDLPYGETKAGLSTLLRRHRSETGWPHGIRPVAARIGWVRGTGLMAANAPIEGLVEQRLGVRTFAAEEMAELVVAAAMAAERRPTPDPVTGRPPVVEADLSGGLGAVVDLRARLDELGAELVDAATTAAERARLAAALTAAVGGAQMPTPSPVVDALPSPTTGVAPPPVTGAASWPALPAGLEPADTVVVVGVGELGPLGTTTTRGAYERDPALTADTVAELAWLCGLTAYDSASAQPTWVDRGTGEPVAEADLASRYRDEVRSRIGLRPLGDDGVIEAGWVEVYSPVPLTRDVVVDVPSAEVARSYADAHAGHVSVTPLADGQHRVTIQAGAVVHVPRRAPLPRRVVGQFPTGFDLSVWGIPPDLAATVDRMALVNLVATTEAFLDAGFSPEELLEAVHPSLVANVQGAGMGGMASLRRMLVDNLLDGSRQPDRLQETLVNVVAAHTVQSLVGSYGPMVHPVAACATAAVSVEEAFDKITLGKALAAVAGGFDDLTPDGMIGFADMGATAPDAALAAAGLAPEEMSRPNDRRRSGFVESQGGGTVLLVRGDVALELGLPVRAVVAWAGSFGDGIQTSIPSPGIGMLSAVRGGPSSPLGRALARWGLTADDVAVVSKHDTSTELNDLNEAYLHQQLQDALGRTPGNPLLVVSQKAFTGHGKGGAAAWQLAGLCQVLEDGVVPGNPNLEGIDPRLAPYDHLALGDRSLRLSSTTRPRAALLSSLGFGHVSALIALLSPDAFLAAVPVEERQRYLARAAHRRAKGEQARLAQRLGRHTFTKRVDRRLGEGTAEELRQREAGVLLDPDGRLGGDHRSSR
jgi:fatty acid synthase